MRPWFLSVNLPASPSSFLKTALGEIYKKKGFGSPHLISLRFFQDVKTEVQSVFASSIDTEPVMGKYAWRTPGTAEPGGLPSMGLHRVGHN